MSAVSSGQAEAGAAHPERSEGGMAAAVRQISEGEPIRTEQ